MRKMMLRIPLLVMVSTLVILSGRTGHGQAQAVRPPEPRAPSAEAASAPAAAPPLYKLDEAFLQWPLPPGAEAYADLDGKRMHQYVVEQSGISRRYRDQGHPQFWGRIIGTSADAESASWLAGKFKQIGLAEVRVQSLDLGPQWMPQSWTVTVTGGGRTFALESAHPVYGASGTTGAGLDLEAVYVGLGSEADFAGKDVRGKAVFVYSVLRPGSAARSEGALRAQKNGAAAIFVDILTKPGNMRYQSYPVDTTVPTFSLGTDDGYAVRDLIGQALSTGSGQAPRVKVRLDVKVEPNLKTALVWGTLPGATDETVYVIAHRDGFFDAAGDNAAGVASMIGLAEHYAKIPMAQRRRTMVFIGLDGHHNSGAGAAVGTNWLYDHRDQFFGKTALMVNCEHPSTLQTYANVVGAVLVRANTYTAQEWYVGGPSRPKLQDIAVKAFREFGVPTYAAPSRQPPAGDLSRFYRIVPGIATSDFNHFFHTDDETPETVPWTGLEATTRAYARIIDEVNKLDLKELQRPPEQPTAGN